MEKINQISISELKVETPLGSGSFGQVFKGIWTSKTGEHVVAIKRFFRGLNTREVSK